MATILDSSEFPVEAIGNGNGIDIALKISNSPFKSNKGRDMTIKILATSKTVVHVKNCQIFLWVIWKLQYAR